jgi:hypothetical protein
VSLSREPCCLGEHVRLGVDADAVVEEARELQQKQAGAAAEVEKTALPAATEPPQMVD